MQKLPEGSNRKRRWHIHKRKRHSSWQRRPYYLSLSSGVRRTNNTILLSGVLGTTHTSLDVASVSPFTLKQPSLYWSALCWNIQDPLLDYKLTLTGLWQTSKRKLTLMEARNIQMRTNTYMKRFNVFWYLNWGIQPFQCIQENLPHPWNGCWTQ